MSRAGLAAAIFALASIAQAAGLPAPVREALSKAGVPLSAAAVLVAPVEGKAPLVAHNDQAPLNPASVMKLVTSFAALETLGPAFTFRTEFYATGELANGILDGSLYIHGGGDPKLTYERLWQLAHELRRRGVREIRGDIVIDRSYFASAPHDPASFDKEPRRAYNVGADAFLVNFGAMTFRFVPEAGGVRVTGDPDLPNVEIVSRLKATAEPCENYRARITHEIVETGLLATAFFEGSYPVACGERAWPLLVFDTPRFAESVLRWVWSESGGVLRGKVVAGSVPERARLLHRHESEPLANLVRDMNKYSNNVMARHLFLALSAEPTGRGGDPRESARRVGEWLDARGLDHRGVVVENGSGLSRNERASAAFLAALLRSAWASPVMPELASSMPLWGGDGTLKSRRAGLVAGHAHLKGGTLGDVQSIAGYVLGADGRRWIVVMIVNHPRAGLAQPALDALVDWTYREAGRQAGRMR